MGDQQLGRVLSFNIFDDYEKKYQSWLRDKTTQWGESYKGSWLDEKTGLLELTYNWDAENYKSGRNFGHLAFHVENIYTKCQHLIERGVTINRPPRDGHMAFVKSPVNISIEILQEGYLDPKEPWVSMKNIGEW